MRRCVFNYCKCWNRNSIKSLLVCAKEYWDHPSGYRNLLPRSDSSHGGWFSSDKSPCYPTWTWRKDHSYLNFNNQCNIFCYLSKTALSVSLARHLPYRMNLWRPSRAPALGRHGDEKDREAGSIRVAASTSRAVRMIRTLQALSTPSWKGGKEVLTFDKNPPFPDTTTTKQGKALRPLRQNAILLSVRQRIHQVTNDMSFQAFAGELCRRPRRNK